MNVNAARTSRVLVAPVAASLFVLGFEVLRGAKDSMWEDEGFSYARAHLPFGSFFHQVWTDGPNMGPYYFVLWFWVRLGDSDTWIRFLSALATVAAIWGIFVVVRRWSGGRVAAVAVAVFALTPFVLSWSMQARGYSFSMAFAAWSLVFADRVVRGEGRRSGAVSAGLFGLMAGLAVASQLSTGFVVLGIALAMIALEPAWRMARSLAVAGVVAFLCLSPFVNAMTQNSDQVGWIQPLNRDRFVESILEVSSGEFLGMIIAIGMVCLVMASFRDDRFRLYLLPLAGVVSGVAGLVLVSIFLRPMFIGRYLAACVPLAVVAAVGGWSSLRARRCSNRSLVIGAVAIVGVLFVNLQVSMDQTRLFREDFRGAAAFLETTATASDVVVADPMFFRFGIRRYLKGSIPTYILSRGGGRPDSVALRDGSGRTFRGDRVWVMLSTDPWRRSPDNSDWIESEFPEVLEHKDFAGLVLELREKPSGT